jgi:hypothetical protein
MRNKNINNYKRKKKQILPMDGSSPRPGRPPTARTPRLYDVISCDVSLKRHIVVEDATCE